jgi:hypothetical protein
LQNAIFGIVALAALRTDEERAQMSAFAIVIIGDSEGSATAAGNQEDFRELIGAFIHAVTTFSGSIQFAAAMAVDLVKAVQIGSYIAGVFAAFWAVKVYRNNSRRERARWAEGLYSRFYEKDELKRVRDVLDCEAGTAEVAKLVTVESSDWTDYLNFFEFVAYLQSSKQLSKGDVDALFSYYLGCLKRHPEVVAYVRNKEKGYEFLSKVLLDE